MGSICVDLNAQPFLIYFSKLELHLLHKSKEPATKMSKSPWLWLLIEEIYELKKNRNFLYLSKRDNKLKFWFSDQW